MDDKDLQKYLYSCISIGEIEAILSEIVKAETLTTEQLYSVCTSGVKSDNEVEVIPSVDTITEVGRITDLLNADIKKFATHGFNLKGVGKASKVLVDQEFIDGLKKTRDIIIRRYIESFNSECADEAFFLVAFKD